MSTTAVCETCDGVGWVPTVIDGVRRMARCECFRASLPQVAEGVPIEERDAWFETFTVTKDNQAAAKFAPKWLAEGDRDLYLFGSVGSGKTRLACSIANEAQKAGTKALFLRVPMFLLRLQPSGGDESELFWKAAQVPLLVLDDVGAERESASDFTRRTVALLYQERHDHGRRTIFTSNLTLLDLSEFMQDERLSSRIKGWADLVALDGADWRMRRRGR